MVKTQGDIHWPGIIMTGVVILFVIFFVFAAKEEHKTEEKVKECYYLDLKECVVCCNKQSNFYYTISEKDCKLDCFISNEIRK